MLKKVLHKHGIHIENIRYGKNGKPEIDDIFFNISHSKDMVICAISGKSSVGCDIEFISQVKDGIIQRFFTQNERQYLNLFENGIKQKEFFRLWTIKESYIKMTGYGMNMPLNSFDVVIDEFVKIYRNQKLCLCNIKEYDVPGYCLSVCANESEFTEKIESINLL